VSPAQVRAREEGTPATSAGESALCPVCACAGSSVRRVTLKALLTAVALRRLDGRDYRFCADPDCDVVYFDNTSHSMFRRTDLRVRVGVKERADPIPICYCFDVTRARIREEIAARGATNLPQAIAAEVRAGHCACEVRNPRGTCCLSDLAKAVESAEFALKSNGER
jgi:hypothetical protein